ncbi:unnamed protein product [Polarella glacialis]|uniref:Uncharacterized protein n=1 Tax=Polarella glacialis TaxID=89957 RepID=A0A813JNE9_POLGL|nr:unnamed protein product [Polarella glacialis]
MTSLFKPPAWPTCIWTLSKFSLHLPPHVIYVLTRSPRFFGALCGPRRPAAESFRSFRFRRRVSAFGCGAEDSTTKNNKKYNNNNQKNNNNKQTEITTNIITTIIIHSV